MNKSGKKKTLKKIAKKTEKIPRYIKIKNSLLKKKIWGWNLGNEIKFEIDRAFLAELSAQIHDNKRR